MNAPRKIDEGVVRNKLDAIRRALETLESAGAVDATRLGHDALIAAAIERLLCRVVELAVEVNAHISATTLGRAPGDYRESFTLATQAGAISSDLSAQLRGSVGLRNTIVHQYTDIDYAIVARSIPLALTGYADYCRQVAAFVLKAVGQ